MNSATSLINTTTSKPLRRSSNHTETTETIDLSSASFGCEDIVMPASPKKITKTSSSAKKTSSSGKSLRRLKEPMDKQSKKEALKRLVSKEMMNVWKVEEEEEPPPPAETAIQPSSSADLFYAMMNGEDVNATASLCGRLLEEPQKVEGLEDDFDDDMTNTFDQKSFADFIFKDEQVPMQGGKSTQKLSRRGSVSSSSSNQSGTSYSSTSNTGSDGLSVREIEHFVMENMPKHVRDQIPKEAWGKIFGRAQADKVRKPKSKKITEEEKEEPDVDDNVSTVSAVTEATEYRVAKHGFVTKKDSEAPDDIPGTVPVSWSSGSYDSETSKRPSGNRIDFTGRVVAAEKKDGVKKENLSVSFNNVQVRYYERILDLNPSVTNGAAIGLGWRYKKGGKLPIDEWELRKDEARRPNELLLPKHVRERMLKDLGYTQQDIASAVRVILKAKNKRKQTVQNLGAESMEEAVESATRRVKGILSMGMKNGLVKA